MSVEQRCCFLSALANFLWRKSLGRHPNDFRDRRRHERLDPVEALDNAMAAPAVEQHRYTEASDSRVHRAPWTSGFLASGARNSTSEMHVSRNCVPRCTPLITSLILFTGFV